MSLQLAELIQERLPLVKGFLDMTTTYVLSREWQDLLSMYIFKLHPLPHCSEDNKVGYSFLGFVSRSGMDDRPGCSAEARASTQGVFAILLLLSAAALQGATQKALADLPHVTEQVTSIIGMCVGWGAGDAVIKLLLELHPPSATKEAIAKAAKAAADAAAEVAAKAAAAETASKVASGDADRSDGSDGTRLRRFLASATEPAIGSSQFVFVADENLDRVLFALAYSLLACLMITMLHPLVSSGQLWDLKSGSEAGVAPTRDARSSGWRVVCHSASSLGGSLRTLRRILLEWTAEASYALWSLATRALTTSTLMLWTYVSSSNLLDGLRAEQRGGGLHWRLLVLWALVLTVVGAAITVKTLQLRSAIEDAVNHEGDEAPARAWQQLQEEGGQREAATSEAMALAVCSRAWWRRESRAAAVQVLLLLEKVLAWMAGCAWTDVFFSRTAPDPNGWLAAKDLAVALALTCFALAWMVIQGDLDDAVLGIAQGTNGKPVDRSFVESHFVVYSASFFVGWSWVVLLRDVAAVTGQARLRPPEGDYLSSFAHLVGLETLETVRTAELNAFLRSLAMLVFFGPVLTALTIYLKGVALRAYARGGGTHAKQRLKDLLAQAETEDRELETRFERGLRALRQSPGSDKNLLAAAGISSDAVVVVAAAPASESP